MREGDSPRVRRSARHAPSEKDPERPRKLDRMARQRDAATRVEDDLDGLRSLRVESSQRREARVRTARNRASPSPSVELAATEACCERRRHPLERERKLEAEVRCVQELGELDPEAPDDSDGQPACRDRSAGTPRARSVRRAAPGTCRASPQTRRGPAPPRRGSCPSVAGVVGSHGWSRTSRTGSARRSTAGLSAPWPWPELPGPIMKSRMTDSASKELFARAARVLPGGVNSPVRAFRRRGRRPGLHRASARVQDLRRRWEGVRRLRIGSWGPAILGHAFPPVVRAVQRAAEKGLSFGAPTARRGRLRGSR